MEQSFKISRFTYTFWLIHHLSNLSIAVIGMIAVTERFTVHAHNGKEEVETGLLQ